MDGMMYARTTSQVTPRRGDVLGTGLAEPLAHGLGGHPSHVVPVSHAGPALIPAGSLVILAWMLRGWHIVPAQG